MSFDALPDLPEMILPQGKAYIEKVITDGRKAASSLRSAIDVKYGDDYFQMNDYYMPNDESLTGLPVMCFLHGGAWRNGCKEWMAFMAPAVTATPAVFVSVSYRIAPHVRMPDIVSDCFDALAQVYNTVERYGGNPNRIFVGGHSAGGHLSALMTLRRDMSVARGLPSDVVKACMPVGGIYDLEKHQVDPDTWFDVVYPLIFEDPSDQELAASLSPVAHTKDNDTPFLISCGENDVPEAIKTSKELTEALRANGTARVDNHVWPVLDHFEANLEQGNMDSPWIAKMREWMDKLPS